MAETMIAVDGGEVWADEMPTVAPKVPQEYHTLMGWADAVRRMRVRANAETPEFKAFRETLAD